MVEHIALQGCLEACRRCEQVVAVLMARGAEDAACFRSAGPHLRHCIDHFVCLLRGLRRGTVDYDARERDPAVEYDPRAFLEALGRVRDDLAALERIDPATTLRVVQAAAPGAASLATETNLERELVFLSSHTIHHLAIVAMIVRGRGIEIPEALYTAYSTAAYREQLAIERA